MAKRRRRFDLDANPVRLALIGRKPTAAADLVTIRMREAWAVGAFSDGTATVQAWHDVDRAQRVAAALGRAGIGPEALPLAEAVAQALALIWRVGGAMRLDAEGLAQMRELLAVHDAQREAATRAEYEAAIWSALRPV